MTIKEFLFYDTKYRRDRNESVHDLLVVAKDGLKKTAIMYRANISWVPFVELFKLVEDAGLIEEVEETNNRWDQKPTLVWKTTEKGLKYAEGVYNNSKLLEEVKD